MGRQWSASAQARQRHHGCGKRDSPLRGLGQATWGQATGRAGSWLTAVRTRFPAQRWRPPWREVWLLYLQTKRPRLGSCLVAGSALGKAAMSPGSPRPEQLAGKGQAVRVCPSRAHATAGTASLLLKVSLPRCRGSAIGRPSFQQRLHRPLSPRRMVPEDARRASYIPQPPCPSSSCARQGGKELTG